MLPDRVSNPGPLTYEASALPIALRGPARLNKFSFYSAKHWKGKIRSRLNDIFIVSISLLFFLIKFPFCFSCFNFHSILYRFNDLSYRLNDIISRLNEIFFVLISVLISLFQFLF